MTVEVSVVLPAYNEEGSIEGTIYTTLETLGSFLPAGTFEVLVAEDGCDDRTPEIAARIAGEHPNVRHIHSDERLGRGGALERAFRLAEGDTLAYIDTDLATDMRHLEELIESVRSGEWDVATGSRWMPENVADRPFKRDIASRGFNGLTRLFLPTDLRDHQCGFKSFSREALDDILPAVEDEHWFWDTEVLVRAQRQGYRVKEFAVEWEPKGDTKVDLVRDVFGMGSQILRTWWEFSVSPRLTPRVTLTAGTLLVFAALAIMVSVYLDPTDVLTAMRGADYGVVAVAALLYAVSWPVRGLRYRDILSRLGYPEQVGFLTGAIFISQTGNLVFPARAGDAVRAYVVKARRKIPYPTGFASLAVERVFDLLTISAIAGAVLLGLSAGGLDLSGLDALPVEQRASGLLAIRVAAFVAAAVIVALVVILLTARTERNYVRRFITRLSNDSYADYVAGVVEQFTGDVQAVTSDRRAFLRVGASSIAIWTLDVLTALLVFLAFDVTIDPVTLLAVTFFAVSVGNLAKVLPLSPGGIGLYEGAFTLLVVALTGISPAVALGAAVVDHAVKNLVTIAGGVVSTAWLNVSLTTAVEESREAEAADLD